MKVIGVVVAVCVALALLGGPFSLLHGVFCVTFGLVFGLLGGLFGLGVGLLAAAFGIVFGVGSTVLGLAFAALVLTAPLLFLGALAYGAMRLLTA